MRPCAYQTEKKPQRWTTPTQQWTSIEKQQHKNSQIALIGEPLKRVHGSDSAGVELHIRCIMLAFKKHTQNQPKATVTKQIHQRVCVFVRRVLSHSAGKRR